MTWPEFERFNGLIYQHSGIKLGRDKRDLLQARLGKILRAERIPSYGRYYERVVGDSTGQELIRLIDLVSTNLTYFYREPQHFHILEEEILPRLVEDKAHRGERRIRFWSAGCSSGEEAYTLVMVTRPFLEPPGAWDFKVLASDISTRVLARAKTAVYNPEQAKGLIPGLLDRCFLHLDEGLLVKPEIKNLVTFARINLHESFPVKGPFDLIFCRNVMIYFDRESQEKLINRFWEYLAPGGHLFIGHSENLTGLDHRFRYVYPAVYRK